MNLLERAASIGVEGFMHPNELEKLAELATGNDVLEIGSFKGLSTWAMALVAKSVMSVDTHKANSAGQFQVNEHTTLEDFRRAISGLNNVAYYVGSSEDAHRNGLVSPHCTEWNMIFLDAMHTYEDVKADIERWYPVLKQGGLMVFHDYDHPHFPGVKQAVDERLGVLNNTVGTLAWLIKQ